MFAAGIAQHGDGVNQPRKAMREDGGSVRTPAGSSWTDRLAHDLRGPLSPLQTAVYLLRQPRVSDTERTELLDVIDRQTSRLSGMIDEISDWVRAQNGRLVTREETVDLDLLLADTVARMPSPPELALPASLQGAELRGDVVRLGQLLRTLLEFPQPPSTAPAGVTIEWAAPGRLRVRRPLAAPAAGKVDTASVLTDPLRDAPDDGLGLRMLIASAIAAAHGGELRVEDAQGPSPCLVLELPARPGHGAD